jgi:hypothetical protein
MKAFLNGQECMKICKGLGIDTKYPISLPDDGEDLDQGSDKDEGEGNDSDDPELPLHIHD